MTSQSGGAKNSLIVGICLAAIAVSAYFILRQWTSDGRGTNYDALADRVAGKRMAREIDPLLKSGGKVVVLTFAEDRANAAAKAAFEGFEEELSSRRPQTEIERVDPFSLMSSGSEDGNGATMIAESGLPPEMFSRLVSEHRGAAGIVSLLGVPASYQGTGISSGDRPAIGVLDSMWLSGQSWKEWIRDGRIDFIILPKVEIDYAAELEDQTEQEIFDARFLLVKPGHVEEAADQLGGYY